MKKLTGILCYGFIVISLSGCAQILLTEAIILSSKAVNTKTDYRGDEKGKQCIETWASDNIAIGNSESEILQRLGQPIASHCQEFAVVKTSEDEIFQCFGSPLRKDLDFWIYEIPNNGAPIPKDLNLLAAILFSGGKVASWLGYSYQTGSLIKVSSLTSYKNIYLGMPRDEVATEPSNEIMVYKGTDIWLFWEKPNREVSLFLKNSGASTIAAIIFQDGKVAFIFCFKALESTFDITSSGSHKLILHPSMIAMPEK